MRTELHRERATVPLLLDAYWDQFNFPLKGQLIQCQGGSQRKSSYNVGKGSVCQRSSLRVRLIHAIAISYRPRTSLAMTCRTCLRAWI